MTATVTKEDINSIIQSLEKKYPSVDSKMEEYFSDMIHIYIEDLEKLLIQEPTKEVLYTIQNKKEKLENIYFSRQEDKHIIAALNETYTESLLKLSLQKVRAYEECRLKTEATKLQNRIADIEKKKSAFTTNGQTEQEIIQQMNEKHAVFTEMKDYLILVETQGGEPIFQKESDFRKVYQDQIVAKIQGKEKTKADIWLKSPLKRAYKKIVFEPFVQESQKQNSENYNLWKGFAYEPRQGDVSIFKNFVKDVICSENECHFEYLWKWIARMFQKPQEVGEVGVVLVGKQGTGKNTLVEILGNIFGKHFSQLSSLEQLLGRFDFHHATSILIHANEALWGGDKRDIGKLKTLITEKYVTVEQKHRDPMTLKNCRHIVFSSNEDWPIHLDRDDRRFFVLEVSDQRKEDHDYFKNIWNFIEKDQGYEKILHEFLNIDLESFNVRDVPRQTQKAFFVKMESATSVEQYIYEALKEKSFRLHNNDTSGAEWQEESFEIDKHQLYMHYTNWCENEHLAPQTSHKMSRALKKIIPSIIESRTRQSGTRTYLCSLPGVNQAKSEFEKSYKAQGSDIWGDKVGTDKQS